MPQLSEHPGVLRRPILATIVMSVAAAMSGCGWLFVDGPPAGAAPGTAYIPCTDSKVLPTLDAVMAGLQVVNIIYVSGMDDYDFEDQFGDTEKGAVMGMQALFGTLWGFSAWSGFGKVSDCRAARMAASSEDRARAAYAAQIRDWRPPLLLPTRPFTPRTPTKMPNEGR